MIKSAKAIQKLMLILMLLMTGIIATLSYSFIIWNQYEQMPYGECGTVSEDYDPLPCNPFPLKLDNIMRENVDFKHGKELFLANCASCHSVDMKKDLTGPALGDFMKNWNYDTSRVYQFIRNSQDLIAQGDTYATSLYQQWGSVMTPFPTLNNEDIDDILAYIYAGPCY